MVSGSYVHSALANPKSSPSGKFTLGKYAALVLFRRTGETQSGTPSSDIGRRLSQHVVGMNPKIIGEYKPPTAEGKYGKPKGSPNNYQDVLKYMHI